MQHVVPNPIFAVVVEVLHLLLGCNPANATRGGDIQRALQWVRDQRNVPLVVRALLQFDSERLHRDGVDAGLDFFRPTHLNQRAFVAVDRDLKLQRGVIGHVVVKHRRLGDGVPNRLWRQYVHHRHGHEVIGILALSSTDSTANPIIRRTDVWQLQSTTDSSAHAGFGGTHLRQHQTASDTSADASPGCAGVRQHQPTANAASDSCFRCAGVRQHQAASDASSHAGLGCAGIRRREKSTRTGLSLGGWQGQKTDGCKAADTKHGHALNQVFCSHKLNFIELRRYSAPGFQACQIELHHYLNFFFMSQPALFEHFMTGVVCIMTRRSCFWLVLFHENRIWCAIGVRLFYRL